MQEPARKGIVALFYKGARYARPVSGGNRTGQREFQRF